MSIITVCYRNPEDLEQTLASIDGLDSGLFEVIIVDGSPDDSCAAVAARFPAFRHLHGPDKGKYDAMNKGIGAARGDAVIFMNSGDRLHDATAFSDVVRRHRDILASTIVFGDSIQMVDGELIEIGAPEPNDTNLRRGTVPLHQSILIPTEFHRRNLYDRDSYFSADTRFLKKAFRLLPRLHEPVPIGVFAYGGACTSPGSWRLLAKQYRELCAARDLSFFERVGAGASLVRRKLFHLVAGEAALQRIQARRLKRSSAQSS